MLREIKDKIEALPGVLEVEIGGDREEVLEILVDASSMEAYGLDPSVVMGLIFSVARSFTYRSFLWINETFFPSGEYSAKVCGL